MYSMNLESFGLSLNKLTRMPYVSAAVVEPAIATWLPSSSLLTNQFVSLTSMTMSDDDELEEVSALPVDVDRAEYSDIVDRLLLDWEDFIPSCQSESSMTSSGLSAAVSMTSIEVMSPTDVVSVPSQIRLTTGLSLDSGLGEQGGSVGDRTYSVSSVSCGNTGSGCFADDSFTRENVTFPFASTCVSKPSCEVGQPTPTNITG
jgi:hypothetical protein